MRYLGIDFGERRIGVAVSDQAARMALVVGTIERRDDYSAIAELRTMAVERDVEGLVVGRPMHLDGRPSKMALRAQRFGTRLAAACKLPIHFIDEALTSVEASREHLSESGRGGGIDATSACILLQDYLDQESRT